MTKLTKFGFLCAYNMCYTKLNSGDDDPVTPYKACFTFTYRIMMERET